MARAIYEYTKTILTKVSFNSELFSKELQKAIKSLLPYEIEELKIFVKKLVLQNPDLNDCVHLLNPI